MQRLPGTREYKSQARTAGIGAWSESMRRDAKPSMSGVIIKLMAVTPSSSMPSRVFTSPSWLAKLSSTNANSPTCKTAFRPLRSDLCTKAACYGTASDKHLQDGTSMLARLQKEQMPSSVYRCALWKQSRYHNVMAVRWLISPSQCQT